VLIILAFALSAFATSDTTIVLGSATRDLTGDHTPDTLTLRGVGPSADSLNLRLTIKSGTRIIFDVQLHPISRMHYEREIRPYLRLTYEEWLKDLGQSFFSDRKFLTPAAFVTQMKASAPGHVPLIPQVIARAGGFEADTARAMTIWSEIQRSDVVIFEYSPGGDVITAIAWSKRDRRFYDLIQCC
jgi:hypothetical protein